MIDKTLKRITQEIALELNIPLKQVIAIVEQQHKDILTQAKDRDISFIFLKYFGTFASHANSRRPFRNDKYTQ